MKVVTVARKPLSESSVAQNVLEHGTGAINIDGCRISMGEEYDPTKIQRQQSAGRGSIRGAFGAGSLVGTEIPTYKPGGRWPANLILSTKHTSGMFGIGQPGQIYTAVDGDNLSAARFFKSVNMEDPE